jgi:hypothetical protein
MNTIRRFDVAVALLSAVMCSALHGWAEKSGAGGQQEPGEQKQHREMAVLFQPDNDTAQGQEAQQKVTLELIAADTEVVKGKPYSADTTTETTQTLADGNHIVHRTVSKFYRDSEGRTRREQTFGNVDLEHPSPHEIKVFIDDPVNGTAFVLDPGSRSANEVHRPRRILDERNGEDEGTKIMFKSVKDGEIGEQNASGRMMLKLQDEHSGSPNTFVMQITNDKREIAREDLGTRDIEGVNCSGTRQTITIPSGAIGNEKPISIVSETWFAPEIAAVVQSTTDDPRYGKTTYQLTNVQLNEPPRSMFEPPAGFKVNERK